MSRHDDLVRLRHMRDAAREAAGFVAPRAYTDLHADRQLTLALVKEVEIIGEAAARLSDDALARWDDVPWAAIVGMRNRLVHEYGAVDADEVYRTVVVDLPELLERLGPLPADTEDAG